MNIAPTATGGTLASNGTHAGAVAVWHERDFEGDRAVFLGVGVHVFDVGDDLREFVIEPFDCGSATEVGEVYGCCGGLFHRCPFGRGLRERTIVARSRGGCDTIFSAVQNPAEKICGVII